MYPKFRQIPIPIITYSIIGPKTNKKKRKKEIKFTKIPINNVTFMVCMILPQMVRNLIYRSVENHISRNSIPAIHYRC